MLRYLFYFLFYIVLLSLSCRPTTSEKTANEYSELGWKAVYKHDEDGKAIFGSMDSLIHGIRNGYSVRVGWGWERERGDSLLRLEHMAQPLYLSIIQENDVSAIIDAHPLLQSYMDIDHQKFGEGGHIWQCIMTTKGTFNAQVYNRTTGELMKNWPQKHRMTWFLEYPKKQNSNPQPLFQ
ncbi:MAG: hypothetical protein WBG90_05195 [Saonia sp.]